MKYSMQQETDREEWNQQAEQLILLWNIAAVEYDLAGRAACVLEMMQLMDETKGAVSTKTLEFFDNKIKVLIYAALEAVSHHEGGLAVHYLSNFPKSILGELYCLPDYRYWQGRAAYEQQDWQQAKKWFCRQTAFDAADELAWFFLGNCCWQQGKRADALTAYTTALERNPYFEEAQFNAAVVLRELGEAAVACELLQQLPQADLDPFPKILERLSDRWIREFLRQPERCYEIPIFINSRDRLVCLRSLVEWLCDAGYKKIIILDNASTYPPLREYYQELMTRGIKVIDLQQNLGHKALWDADILNRLSVRTPYVYTDSDVLPGSGCRPDIVYLLLQQLGRYSWLKKAGPALAIEDITFYDKEWIQIQEAPYWQYPVDEDVYAAAIDTTFALYRPYHRYVIQEAVRLGGACTFHHLPWYYDYQAMPEDEQYYLDHAGGSSTAAKRYRGEAV